MRFRRDRTHFWARLRRRALLHIDPSGDDVVGYLAQGEIPVAGVGAHNCECVVHRGGEDAFGLLDQNPRIEHALQLLSHVVSVADVAFLQITDRGDISERLGDSDIFRDKRAGVMAEQVPGADELPAKAHRGGMNRSEAEFQRLC